MEALSQAVSASAALRDDPDCKAVSRTPWAPVEHVGAESASDVWRQDDAQGQGYAKKRRFLFGTKHGRVSRWLVDDMTPFMVRAPGYWAIKVAYDPRCGFDSLERVFVYPTANTMEDFQARRKAQRILPIINPLPDPPGPGEDREIKTIKKQVLVQLWSRRSVSAATEAVQEVDASCLEEVAVARVLAEMRENRLEKTRRTTRAAAVAAAPSAPANALGTSAESYGATVYADLAASTEGSPILDTTLSSFSAFIPKLNILQEAVGNQNRNFVSLTFNEEPAEKLGAVVVDFIQYNMRHSTAFDALLKSSFGTRDPELYPHFHVLTQTWQTRDSKLSQQLFHKDCEGPVVAIAFQLNRQPLGTLFALHGVGEPHFVAHTPCFAFESSCLHAGPAAPVPPGVTAFPHVSRDRVFVYIVSSKHRGLAAAQQQMMQHSAPGLRPETGDRMIALRDGATR